MACGYRLEDVEADKTAEIKKRKEEQRKKQEQEWKKQQEYPSQPPVKDAVRDYPHARPSA
jgi:hypothetical protein